MMKLLITLFLLAACAAEASRVETDSSASDPQAKSFYKLPPIVNIGRVRQVFAPSACQSKTGVPHLRWLSGRAEMGGEVVIHGVTRLHADPPPELCALVCSFDSSEPLDGTPYGAPGCWLLVKPDFIISPAFGQPPSDQKRFTVWGSKGNIYCSWKPNASDIGLTLRMQMLTLSPGANKLGLLASNAVEIIVGKGLNTRASHD